MDVSLMEVSYNEFCDLNIPLEMSVTLKGPVCGIY